MEPDRFIRGIGSKEFTGSNLFLVLCIHELGYMSRWKNRWSYYAWLCSIILKDEGENLGWTEGQRENMKELNKREKVKEKKNTEIVFQNEKKKIKLKMIWGINDVKKKTEEIKLKKGNNDKKISVKAKENDNFEGRKNGKSTENWNSKN